MEVVGSSPIATAKFTLPWSNWIGHQSSKLDGVGSSPTGSANMVSVMIEEMVNLWLALREDPSDLKFGIQRINLFLKRADFTTENAYYVMLHGRLAERFIVAPC